MFNRYRQQLSPAAKYWVFLLGIIGVIFVVILGSFVASYLSLEPADRLIVAEIFPRLVPFPLLGAMLLVVIIGTLVRWLFIDYIIPILRMAEQTRLITMANPEYRVNVAGAPEVMALAKIVNESAEAFQRLQREVETSIEEANLALRQERNRFAALLSELPHGVLVCNTEGQILLYNRKAQLWLEEAAPTEENRRQTGDNCLGLGRSLFDFLDREPIAHVLEMMTHALHRGPLSPVLGLMTKLCGERFIRVNMAPVTSAAEQATTLDGFVLTLEDITSELAAESERDYQLQRLIDAIQHSLGELNKQMTLVYALPGIGPATCNLHRKGVEGITVILEQQLALARELYSRHRLAAVTREPLTLPEEAVTGPAQIAPRPIYYEFDLFHQPGQQALGHLPLRKLTFVVFDTETTGLDPTGGDEILQLGAVRIVNGRLRGDEIIDQLVNPQRPVPASSVEVHGIDPELLKGQPLITEVLPRFHGFARDAVLVAHNAAFDMKMLQLKEAACGVRFDQPVLDTLLLSSIVHPHQDGHSLDTIAARLNVTITGRHTALGDALATAEVLLKLIPLLEAQGVMTLNDALAASARSPYVKLKY